MTRWVAWLRAALQRRRLDREMREEMTQHIERSAERLRARGHSPAEALRMARREFGGLDQIEEEARDARGSRWLETTLKDARFAVRFFARVPGATATMLIVVGIGIALNVALFAILHSLATQPPAGMQRDDAIVRIRGSGVLTAFGIVRLREMSYPEFEEYATQTQLFTSVTAWTRDAAALEVAGIQGRISARLQYVTDGYFELLGVRPSMGSSLPHSGLDASAPLVAVVGHTLWAEHFAASPDAVGSTIRVNGQPVTVVGVAPPRFAGLDGEWRQPTLWLPLANRPAVEQTGGAAFASYDSTFLRAAARLRPGVDIAAAAPIVATIGSRAAAQASDPDLDSPSADLAPMRSTNASPETGLSGETFLAAVGTALGMLVLLIVCANLSTLLIGLAAVRRREMAVRLSLGASRARVVRQLVTENLVLSMAGAALAVALVAAAVRFFGTRFDGFDVVLAWPSILFTGGIALAAGVLFGLSPALHATRLALSDVLKDSAAAIASRPSRLRESLVVGQVALTQPLLIGLVALLVFFVAEWRGRPEATLYDRIIEVEFDGFAAGAPIERSREDMRRLQERLAAQPGIAGVVAQRSGYGIGSVAIHSDDRVAGATQAESFRARFDWAPPGYFELLGIPVVAGRDFTESDANDATSPIIIGRDLARRLWGAADPIGRRLVRTADGDGTAMTVVGLVDEARAGRSDSGSTLRVYEPGTASRLPDALLIRTAGEAESMMPVIRSIAAAEASSMAVVSMRTLAAAEEEVRALVRQASGASAAGGLIALLLASIGLYAVVAFAVAQRTREIGVRVALGAGRRSIMLHFFARGLRLAAIGVLVGMPLSAAALHVLIAQIGLQRMSLPLLVALTAAIIAVVASLATWIPARRAMRVDPLVALRAE